MKKLLTITLIAVALTACSSKYKPDTSGFTEDYKSKEQAFLNDFKAKYEAAESKDDKEKYAFETGFRSMNLGDYDNAIKYYEIALGYNPIHFQALNNLAVIYEEMGDIEKALKYEKELYNKNATNIEVVRDTIRLLAKNNQFKDAQGVLETFIATDTGKTEPDFFRDQMAQLKDLEAEQLKKANK